MAQEAGLDLVEIAPNSVPPVCKILDFGKYKYQAQKKAAEARKKQKVVEIKEIKLRPMIDDHDYDVKMRAMQRFFEEGDKVKITLRYRGREMAHQEIGTKLLDKIKTDVAEYAKVEQDARFEGRQVVMVLASRGGQPRMAARIFTELKRAPASGLFQGEETVMPTFIGMLSWTDQGVRTVKDTPKRIQAAKERGKKLGVDIKQIFLTTGEFDLLVIAEAKDGDAMAKLAMAAGAEWNVRTRTVRAWTESEIAKLISELP